MEEPEPTAEGLSVAASTAMNAISPLSPSLAQEDVERGKFDDRIQRIPDHSIVLTEEYRYDSREGFLRPPRSHRCRHCAAVVLAYDHHCPYVRSSFPDSICTFYINASEVDWTLRRCTESKIL